MNEKFKYFIFVILIFLLLWLLRAFGNNIWPFANINAPKVKVIIKLSFKRLNPQIIWWPEPIMWWGITPEEFKQKSNNQWYQFIDLRDPVSYKRWWRPLQQAINIYAKWSDFLPQIDSLPRGKIYILYDRDGKTAPKVAEIMKYLGFRRVYRLSGWVLAWARKWYKLQRFNN